MNTLVRISSSIAGALDAKTLRLFEIMSIYESQPLINNYFVIIETKHHTYYPSIRNISIVRVLRSQLWCLPASLSNSIQLISKNLLQILFILNHYYTNLLIMKLTFQRRMLFNFIIYLSICLLFCIYLFVY